MIRRHLAKACARGPCVKLLGGAAALAHRALTYQSLGHLEHSCMNMFKNGGAAHDAYQRGLVVGHVWTDGVEFFYHIGFGNLNSDRFTIIQLELGPPSLSRLVQSKSKPGAVLLRCAELLPQSMFSLNGLDVGEPWYMELLKIDICNTHKLDPFGARVFLAVPFKPALEQPMYRQNREGEERRLPIRGPCIRGSQRSPARMIASPALVVEDDPWHLAIEDGDGGEHVDSAQHDGGQHDQLGDAHEESFVSPAIRELEAVVAAWTLSSDSEDEVLEEQPAHDAAPTDHEETVTNDVADRVPPPPVPEVVRAAPHQFHAVKRLPRS